MSDSKTSSGGVGFTGLLTIAFVVLKLCKMIDWSWWWVISPIWISIGIALLILGGIGAYCLYEGYKQKKEFKQRIEKHKSVTGELQDRHNDLAKDIDIRSKWEIRMDEMQQKQKTDIHWSNK